MSWKFWKRKKNEPIYYRGLTMDQFSDFIEGNVIGVIWKSPTYNDIPEEDVDKYCRNHKHMTFAVTGAYIERVPCVCLHYDYDTETKESEFHMIFTHPVKAKYVIGNSFKESDLIYRTPANEHLTEQAVIQFDINEGDNVG